MEWKKDAFGNDLNVGDKVVAATTIIQSPGLRRGVIIAEVGKPVEENNYRDFTPETDIHTKVKIPVQKYKVHWEDFPPFDWEYLCHERFGWSKHKDPIIKGTNLMKI